MTAREQDGETRYGFLETIRQYARDRLREAGEEAEVSRRHREWCVALAEAAEPHLRGPEQIAWLAHLEREHENLSAALGRCVGRGEAEPGLRLSLALWHFWNDRGHTHEGYTWLRRLLALESVQASTALRGAALFLAAKLAFEEGDLVTAQALGEESLEIARAVDDRPTLHRTLTQLGHIARGRGEWLAARQYYEEALPIRREIGEPADVAVSLAGLGHVARALREYAEAEALYRESLELARSQGHASDVTAGQHHLGRLAHERGRDDEAAAWYAEALPVACQINHPRRIAYLLEAFAALAARRQPERALRLAGAADALRRTSGSLLPPSDRADLDRELAPARRLLGERRSEAVRAAGSALSVDDAVAEALAEAGGRPRSRAAGEGGRLSERERQVAALVARGLSNREIAAELALRERTVANHLQRIYARLGLAGRVQLTTWAFEHGLAAATTLGIIAAQQIGQF